MGAGALAKNGGAAENVTGIARHAGSPGEVFRVFLKLGLTSFGGPIAHLGYYRDELVVRRKWIDEAGYVDLVALCQFLPGPASSQVGFSLGVLRGNGVLGGLAAWLGFTMPSALLLLALRPRRGRVYRPGRRRIPARPEARGRRRGGAGGLGHDANAHAGSRAGDDRAGRHRRRRHRRGFVRADRRDRARRGRRPSPLPWRGGAALRTIALSDFAARRDGGPDPVRGVLRGPARPIPRQSGHRAVRSLLSIGRARVRRRPRRAAFAAGGSGRAGLGDERCVPGGLRARSSRFRGRSSRSPLISAP